MSARSRTLSAAAIALAVMLVAVAVFSAGCKPQSSSTTYPPVGVKTAAAKTPPPPMLTNPRSAVYSYLLWISLAYRVLDAQVAKPTFTPSEEVRVDSYVELNRERGRALEQTLTALSIRSVRTVGDASTVAARESWVYRYIDIHKGTYATPPYTVSYDSTYTLNYDRPSKAWRVAHVQVSTNDTVH